MEMKALLLSFRSYCLHNLPTVEDEIVGSKPNCLIAITEAALRGSQDP